MLTIPNTPKVQRVIYRPSFSTRCSIGHAPFSGTIEIDYRPDDVLLEFESFEDWLRADVALGEMTIEDLTRLVFDQLTGLLGGVPLCVAVTASTIVHAPVTCILERKGI